MDQEVFGVDQNLSSMKLHIHGKIHWDGLATVRDIVLYNAVEVEKNDSATLFKTDGGSLWIPNKLVEIQEGMGSSFDCIYLPFWFKIKLEEGNIKK